MSLSVQVLLGQLLLVSQFLVRLDKVQEELLYYPGVGVGGVSKKFNVKVFM